MWSILTIVRIYSEDDESFALVENHSTFDVRTKTLSLLFKFTVDGNFKGKLIYIELSNYGHPNSSSELGYIMVCANNSYNPTFVYRRLRESPSGADKKYQLDSGNGGPNWSIGAGTWWVNQIIKVR